ncbi:SpoIIE family protein phosphatase [Pectobacterium cacticida]|uniref:SpoIIE family protein phosphatase n=1 Tax=Pectobacterium cacticida TaxID=69221 RepID=UPI002FEFD324
MVSSPITHSRSHIRGTPIARDLCIPLPNVSPDADNATVLQLFNQNKEWVSLPVVEEGRPFGLINRHIFLSQMSRPFYRELYDKKSCIAFMDKNPLIVDALAPLHDVANQTVITGDKSLTDGFMITENGRYIGIGLGIDLIKAVSDMHLRQHQQIMQSIEYASVIQAAMLTASTQTMSQTLTDWCLAWEPRDCVGGDYYAFKTYPHGWLAVVADCTGHGVPGAFMTLIFSSALEQSLTQCGPMLPALLLQAINRHIKDTLGQRSEADQLSISNDGCDAMMVFYDMTRNTLTFSGARMPAFMLQRNTGQLMPLQCDRMGIGYTETPYDYQWSSYELPIQDNDIFFTTTDGLTDQIGGERRIMFGKRRLEEHLRHYQNQPMSELANQLLSVHKIYQGDQTRRDDLTFWGFRHCSTVI